MRISRLRLLKFQNGFTLLELVISMTIIAVLAAIIFNGMRLGIRARETGENIEENNQRMRAIYTMISSQIKSAKPYFYSDKEDPKKKKLAFIGKPNSIQFVTAAPRLTPTQKPEGLHESKIYLEEWHEEEYEEGDIRGLVLREDKIRYPRLFEGEGDPVVLAEDVEDLRFRYFFVVNGKDGEPQEMWADSYDEESVEGLEASLKGSEEEAKGEKTSLLTRLPLAIEVAFTISIPREKKGEPSFIKLEFPPTIVFVNLGLEGTPIPNPSVEESEIPGER